MRTILRKIRVIFTRIFVFVILIAIIVGVAGLLTDFDFIGNSPTDTSFIIPTPSGAVTYNINGRVLSWVADGDFPGNHNSANPGVLYLMDGSTRPEVALALPSGTTRVHACGEQSTSPNGQYFSFFVGSAVGSIYTMDGQNTPHEVADNINAISCSGSGTLQYSDDGSVMGYLALQVVTTGDTLNSGTLNLVNTNGFSPLSNFNIPDNVVAYDMRGDKVVYVQVLSEGRNAVISVWDDGELEELPSLAINGENSCSFRTAQVSLTPNDNVAVLLGERCPGGDSTRWSVNVARASGGSFSEITTDEVTGSYFPESRTGRIFATDDSESIYFTVPDGVTRRTVEINQLVFADNEQNTWAEHGTMPRYNNNASLYYSTTEQVSPALALDESLWAIVASDPDGEISIGVFNLVDGEEEPIDINPIFAGETVKSMAFSPTDPFLLYVAGADSEEEENTLYVLNSNGVNEALVRGNFVHLALSPDGQFIALTEWQFPERAGQPNYINMVVLDLSNPNSARQLMFAGAHVTDNGDVQNQQFIYPLSWRPAPPTEAQN